MTDTRDPRPRFSVAGATALTLVTQVTPADLTRPTPCTEFDVRALLGHMLTVFRRSTALALGTDPLAMPQVVTGVADDAWATTFATDLTATLSAWADDTVLDTQMHLPWADLPGRSLLPQYTSEVTVHTWDLAQAIGVPVTWDPGVVEDSLIASARMLPPGDRTGATLPNGVPIPFATAVEVAADASALTRLIAWYGRDPLRS